MEMVRIFSLSLYLDKYFNKILNNYMENKIYEFYYLSSSEFPDKPRYVGVTCAGLSVRFSQHKYVARNSKKRSTPVAKWIFSLTERKLDVLITKISECFEKEWENTEIRLIEEYREAGHSLLNVDIGGKGVITLEKRNKSGIERSISAHEIKVVQLDLLGNYITTFDSIAKATTAMGLSTQSAIGNVLKGRSASSSGYFWFYESDYLKGNYEIPVLKTASDYFGKKYYQYCPITFNLINIFQSERELLKKINGGRDTLLKAVLNKTIFSDYFWANSEVSDFSDYFDNRIKIKELDSSGNIINTFKSYVDAAKHLNTTANIVTYKINKKIPTSNGTFLIINEKIKI